MNPLRRLPWLTLAISVRRATLLRPTFRVEIPLRSLSTTVPRHEEKISEAGHLPTRYVFVGNVPHKASEYELREAFSQFGDIEFVLLKSELGHAIVRFMHLESAKKAFQATLYLRDRLLRVDYAAKFDTRPREPPNNILFLANLPFDTTEAEIYAELGLFGRVKDVRFAKRLNRRLGTAHVEFASKKDAIAAYENLAPNDLFIRGRPVRVRYSQRPPPCRRLFFCDYDGDEEALRLLFRDFESDIQSVKCLRHPVTGESTKNGFIEFGSVERATDAYEELRESKLLKLEYAAHADEKQHRWARRTVHLAERPLPE